MPLCADIIARLQPVAFHGDEQAPVDEILQLGTDVPHARSIVWCADKNREKLREVELGTVIVSQESYAFVSSEGLTGSVNWIVVEQPRRAFLQVVKVFFYRTNEERIIQPTAQIHASAQIDRPTAAIGHNVIIEANVRIGKNATIGHNTVILAGTEIGDDVSIGNNNTIGGVGFGYEKDEDGTYELIPHIGNVRIDDQAEIGNNVAIDRAVLGSTVIGKNVKIDNLVHIAHGVQIGENSLVIANAMVAGSVKIGKNVWVAPSSSIIQNIAIGDDALIGMASNVLKPVEAGSVFAGNPAKKIR